MELICVGTAALSLSAVAHGLSRQKRGEGESPPLSSCHKTGPEGAVQGPCLRTALRYVICG